MTTEEYREWYKSLMARFPSVQQWWERLPEETRKVNSADWRESLARESLADCETALKQIKQGNAESWPEFNREMLGAHVARIARSIRFERESRSEDRPSQNGSRAQRRATTKVIGWYQRLIDLREKGVPQEEAVRIARQEFLTNGVTDERRYSCPDCRDAGTVECWHPDTITRVLRGEDARARYTCHAPCHCHRGDRFIQLETEKSSARIFKPGTKRYSAETHCLVGNALLPTVEADLIRQWAEAARNATVPGEWQYQGANS